MKSGKQFEADKNNAAAARIATPLFFYPTNHPMCEILFLPGVFL
jgi:hypothetical protein